MTKNRKILSFGERLLEVYTDQPAKPRRPFRARTLAEDRREGFIVVAAREFVEALDALQSIASRPSLTPP